MQPCLFLLFHAGERPGADRLRRALAAQDIGQISHDPASGAAGRGDAAHWLEVLIDGLTFDVLGLAPGPSLAAPATRHRFGVPREMQIAEMEAVGVTPGPHLAGAGGSLPVVRTLLRLGAELARQLGGAQAALWQPAGSVMGRELFVEAIDRWTGNDVFPALGLVGVAPDGEGRLASDGLAFFTGQELLLDVRLCADWVQATRLLLRLVDRLVGAPPLAAAETVALSTGDRLLLEPRGRIIGVTPA